jgi:FkbM family methyltransferase
LYGGSSRIKESYFTVIRKIAALLPTSVKSRILAAAKAVIYSGITPEIVSLHAMSTDRALWRIKSRGLDVHTVIDVGASNGMWSALCEKHLPQSKYLLVEAQEVHRSALQAYCKARRNATFVIAAAGDRVGEIYFDNSEPFGGVASYTQTILAKTVTPLTTLNHEVRTQKLPGPYLIKLDTHGFEVPILEGANEILRETNLAIIEAYNFKLCEGALKFQELIEYMHKKGFGVIDISEPLWREKDLSFWQFDLFFVPLSRPELSSNSYR